MFEADPWRIPPIMAALRDTWEAQPELSFAELLDVLHNHGLNWSTSDEEFSTLLNHLNAAHPAHLPRDNAHATGSYLLRTTQPDFLVTVHPTRVILRLTTSPETRPGVWSYHSIERASVAEPLVIRDTAEVQHHLGVIQSIRAITVPSLPLRKGGYLHCRDITTREHTWLLRFPEAIMLLGTHIDLWRIHRRTTEYQHFRWQRLSGLQHPHADCIVDEHMNVGPLQESLLVEAPLPHIRSLSTLK
ncbi:hypothetical protein [Corynebacterium spheniscorum]|uniref:Uncharacterized protein n=1 Tax=Corynebacterium spheniscorum TaxID=185761 RepID=A0A1I2PIC1_9CORY|nr:hypothetical protein [Corynebacterium spheniscorum]KAA8723766.1 hypothetical protein F4V56_02340 [Corynebacterium spheniscorum]SFG15912.1 hypothetical protein SAMN05660282_00072 [Corynebacterium spheniscorum]